MEEIQVHHTVRRLCEEAGSIRKWAKANGLSDEQVRLFLTHKRPPEPKLLKVLGLRRVVTYTSAGVETGLSALKSTAAKEGGE